MQFISALTFIENVDPTTLTATTGPSGDAATHTASTNHAMSDSKTATRVSVSAPSVPTSTTIAALLPIANIDRNRTEEFRMPASPAKSGRDLVENAVASATVQPESVPVRQASENFAVAPPIVAAPPSHEPVPLNAVGENAVVASHDTRDSESDCDDEPGHRVPHHGSASCSDPLSPDMDVQDLSSAASVLIDLHVLSSHDDVVGDSMVVAVGVSAPPSLASNQPASVISRSRAGSTASAVGTADASAMAAAAAATAAVIAADESSEVALRHLEQSQSNQPVVFGSATTIPHDSVQSDQPSPTFTTSTLLCPTPQVDVPLAAALTAVPPLSDLSVAIPEKHDASSSCSGAVDAPSTPMSLRSPVPHIPAIQSPEPDFLDFHSMAPHSNTNRTTTSHSSLASPPVDPFSMYPLGGTSARHPFVDFQSAATANADGNATGTVSSDAMRVALDTASTLSPMELLQWVSRSVSFHVADSSNSGPMPVADILAALASSSGPGASAAPVTMGATPQSTAPLSMSQLLSNPDSVLSSPGQRHGQGYHQSHSVFGHHAHVVSSTGAMMGYGDPPPGAYLPASLSRSSASSRISGGQATLGHVAPEESASTYSPRSYDDIAEPYVRLCCLAICCCCCCCM
jgi:hypothetical protein